MKRVSNAFGKGMKKKGGGSRYTGGEKAEDSTLTGSLTLGSRNRRRKGRRKIVPNVKIKNMTIANRKARDFRED